MEARWSYLGLRALKHDQLPNCPNLVETQYVDTLVIAPDFKVAALDAIQLVEVLDHLALTFTQAKSSGHLDPAMAGIGLYPNLHVCAARDLLRPWHAYLLLEETNRHATSCSPLPTLPRDCAVPNLPNLWRGSAH